MTDCQYAYRKDKSTQDVLFELSEEINQATENNEIMATVFLDIKKAFDSVQHNILIKKLRKLGIRGNAGDVIESYLNNRMQQIKINNGVYSNKEIITSGVPQGSALGSTLFILYTNDMDDYVGKKGLLKYADDTAISNKGKKINQVLSNLRERIKRIEEWLDNNGIVLNKKKSELLISMSERNPERNKLNDYEMIIKGEIIKPSKTVKYLGVLIDFLGNWNEQVEEVLNKLRTSIYLATNVSKKVNFWNKKTIYHALIESILSYAIGIWGSTHKTNLERIQRRINVIIRILFNKKRKENIEKWLSSQKIFSVYMLYCNNITKKIWKSIQNNEKGAIKVTEKPLKTEGVKTRTDGRIQIQKNRWRTMKGKRGNLKRMVEIANKLETEHNFIQKVKMGNKFPKNLIKDIWLSRTDMELKNMFWNT